MSMIAGAALREGTPPRARRAAVLSGTSTSKKRQAYTCLFLLVEMIRLELTTYTLRTYRSTG